MQDEHEEYHKALKEGVEVRFFVNKDQDHNNTSRLVGVATLPGTLIPKRERSDSGIAVLTPSRRGGGGMVGF